MLVFCYVLMCLVFGTTFLGIKLGVEAGAPPFLFAALRFSIAGILVLGYLFAKKHPFPRQSNLYARLFLVGCLNTSIIFGALYWAEQFIPSGLAALLQAASPVMVSLFGAIQHKKGLHVTQIIGLVLGILGVYLMVGNHSTGDHTAIWWQAVLLLIAALCLSAWGAIVSRKLLVEGLSPWIVNGFQMTLGSLGLYVAALVHGETFASITNPQGAIGSLIFLIVIGSMLGWGLYYLLIARINPLLPSTWCYISPLVAMLVGWMWLHETVTSLSLLGGLTVIVGVGLSNWLDWKKLLSQSTFTQNQKKSTESS